jgi:short-subunit dehydrogenase involved in D-alanine esterification of teichoic acids
MHLAIAFLPHFKSKTSGAVIMNVTSIPRYIPFSIINPVYNGTKAFALFWIMNLRAQLKGAGIGVIEIAPPSAGTNLRRDREDPDDNKKDKNPQALTIEEFMKDLVTGWERDNEVIGAGPSIDVTRR